MKYLLLFKDEARSVMLAILVDHWYGFREGIGWLSKEELLGVFGT
jgi:hypothetical protein